MSLVLSSLRPLMNKMFVCLFVCIMLVGACVYAGSLYMKAKGQSLCHPQGHWLLPLRQSLVGLRLTSRTRLTCR